MAEKRNIFLEIRVLRKNSKNFIKTQITQQPKFGLMKLLNNYQISVGNLFQTEWATRFNFFL